MFGLGAQREQPRHAPQESRALQESRYASAVSGLARQYVYDDVPLAEVAKRIETALSNPSLAAIERETGGFESLSHLIHGIEAHERANLYHGGAWQSTLIRQPARWEHHAPPKPAEKLSRQDVADEFAAFHFREQMLKAEEDALKHYGKLLELNTDSVITLSENITLSRLDFEALINDIEVTVAERNPDDAERKAKLKELDERLENIIARIPENERGKRFELEEIYLLRRLIHAEDTGHLVTVSHGTPKQDLRSDRGSVDLQVTAAGDHFGFQMKTFARSVRSSEDRVRQWEILDRANWHLEGSATHLVVLDAQQVQNVYESSIGQEQTQRRSKFAVLRPLTDSLKPKERHKLLTLLGFTEENLKEEQAQFDQQQEQMRAHQEAIRLKRETERERDEEHARKQQEEKKARIAAEEARKQALLFQQTKAAEIAQLKREADALAREENRKKRLEQKEQERAHLESLAAKRKAEEEQLAKKEERRKKREQKALETPAWPPQALANLCTPAMLKTFGLLPADWKNDAQTLLARKRQFINLFAKPKKKNAPVSEADKPNTAFADAFPTEQSLTSPSPEDVERVKALFIKT